MSKIITVTFNPCIDVTLFFKELDKDRANRVENEIREIGGKGINVSRVIKGFDIQNTAFGLAGEENFDEFYKLLGIIKEDSYFEKTPGVVRENITIRSPKDCIKINRPGKEFFKNAFEKMCKAAVEEVETSGFAIIAGSVPEGFNDNHLLQLCKKLKEKNVKIIIDSEWTSYDLLQKIHPFMIKPNIHELSVLLNRDFGDINDIARQLKSIAGSLAENVFVSLGSEGMIALCGSEIYKITVPAIEVKSTVGAGDSTVAGFVVGIQTAMSISDSLRLACACGTATATLEGTRVTDGDLAKKYFNQIQVTKM